MKPQPWPVLKGWVSQRPSRSAIPRVSYQIFGARAFSASTACAYRPLDALPDAHVDTFRQQCFIPERPGVFPRAHFRDLPALKNWFQSSDRSPTTATRLNVEYLQSHAGDAFVPLELTEVAPSDKSPNSEAVSQTDTSDVHTFRKFHAPLTLFLDWMRMAETSSQSSRLYLAQCQLLDLPSILP